MMTRLRAISTTATQRRSAGQAHEGKVPSQDWLTASVDNTLCSYVHEQRSLLHGSADDD